MSLVECFPGCKQWLYSGDSEMKQEYAKLILSLQLLGEIERVKICVQILKNVNKDWKCKQQSMINDLVLLWLWEVCTLFSYLYFEFPIESVKFLEYKSPIIRFSKSLLYYYWVQGPFPKEYVYSATFNRFFSSFVDSCKLFRNKLN